MTGSPYVRAMRNKRRAGIFRGILLLITLIWVVFIVALGL